MVQCRSYKTSMPGYPVTLGGSVKVAEDDYVWLSFNFGWFSEGRRRRLCLVIV